MQNTGLAPNTIYYYRVRAINTNPALNSDYSDEMGARTLNAAPADHAHLTGC
ncbi:MAG: fibronectin type III domain-containing protein [Pyrinomonadaceae bacterium]